MTDREKKIAEIREALEVIKRYDLSTLDNIMMPVYNFCVNAPEWLGFLLEERDKLIEGLRWYADKTNYVQEVHHLRHGTLIGPAEAIYYDEGQRARNILREIGVTVE